MIAIIIIIIITAIMRRLQVERTQRAFRLDC
jgi:hypothetical protein